MPILHRLVLAAFVLVTTMAKAEERMGSPKRHEDAAPESDISSNNKDAIVREAYRQIEEAADRLIANGDSLWKIQEIVKAKRSDAKTADFDRKIQTILGPSTTVGVRFVSYSYDETIFGDEKHRLEWDMLRAATNENTKQHNDSAAAAAQDGPPSPAEPSYRFSFHDPLEDMTLKLPGHWGEFNFLSNFITYKKDSETIGEWTIPCYRKIEREEMTKAMTRDGHYDPGQRLSFSETRALMKQYSHEVEAIVRERFEKSKAETPAFSFAKAVPGLFREMSHALGASETDVERALEAIKSLATQRIHFDDVFDSVPPQDEQCRSCS